MGGSPTSGGEYARAREDRFFEAFGIFPTLNSLRRRLADNKRHTCHERVKDGVLEELSPRNVIPSEEAEKIPNPDPKTVAEKPLILTGKTISPRPLTAQEHRAVIALQAHLRCEDLLSGKATAGRMDRRTSAGLQMYQRLQMLADNGNIDFETRAALLGDSREQDFRAILRTLRGRIVDATGLIEDGSAAGAQGEVQGRVIDPSEFRPLTAPGTPSTPAKPETAKPETAKPETAKAETANAAANAQPAAAPAATADASGKEGAKIVPAADSDLPGDPGGEPGAGLDVTAGGAGEHFGGAAAGQLEKEEGRRTRVRFRCRRRSRSSCRRCRRTTARTWSSARKLTAATWS